MARVSFDDGTILSFPGYTPSDTEIASAHQQVTQAKARTISHPFAEVAAPTVGAMAGGALGSMVAPGPGTAIGSGIGAGGMEGLREVLQGEGLQPKRILATGAGYGAFPLAAEAAAPALEALGPHVAQLLPFIKNFGKEGTVLNTAARSAIGSMAGTTATGIVENRTPEQNRAALGPAAGIGALTGGAVQAFLPPQLGGGGNYWKAVGGNRGAIGDIQASTADQMARADQTVKPQLETMKTGAMQEKALSEDATRAKQQALNVSTEQQQGALKEKATAATAQQQQQEKLIQETFTQKQGESVAARDARIAQSEQALQTTLGNAEAQKTIAENGLLHESDRQVVRVQKDIKSAREAQQDAAWAGVKQLGETSTRRYTADEVKAAAQQEFGQEYGRQTASQQNLMRTLRALPDANVQDTPTETEQKMLSAIAPERRARALASMRASGQESQLPGQFSGGASGERTWSAQDLIDASTKIGSGGSKSVKSGKTAPTAEDLPNIDARTLVARLLDHENPGVMTAGRQQWSDFLKDDALHRKYFSSGKFTDAGRAFLEKLSTGNATLDEQRYFDRLKSALGYDPTESLQPFVQRLKTLPTDVTAAKTTQQLTAQQAKDNFDQLVVSLNAEKTAGVSEAKAQGKMTRDQVARDLKDLLARSDEEQKALANSLEDHEKQIEEKFKASQGAMRSDLAKQKVQIRATSQTAIDGLKRQARIARWLLLAGLFPVRYALINQPVRQALRKH